jgi:hypothetical protein
MLELLGEKGIAVKEARATAAEGKGGMGVKSLEELGAKVGRCGKGEKVIRGEVDGTRGCESEGTESRDGPASLEDRVEGLKEGLRFRR